jgi:hypothetical protein
MYDQLLLLATILACWWHSVAFTKALYLLYWAMHAVWYRCIAMAIKMANKSDVLLCTFHCHQHHGGCWGDME